MSEDDSTYLWKTIGVGVAMVLLTVLGMLLIANTPLADVMLSLYSIFGFLGVIVFGVLLSVGRWVSLHGIKMERYDIAAIGSFILIGAYSWFGGGVLSQFAKELYIPAIIITGFITALITVLIGLYVFTRDVNRSRWKKFAIYSFLSGLALSFVGSFSVASPLMQLAFFLFLFGFIFDMVYEVCVLKHKSRGSPIGDGIAIYVAFAGMFVHILQLVLRNKEGVASFGEMFMD